MLRKDLSLKKRPLWKNNTGIHTLFLTFTADNCVTGEHNDVYSALLHEVASIPDEILVFEVTQSM